MARLHCMRVLLLLILAGCSSPAYVGQSCPSNVNDVSTEGDGRGCKAPVYFKGTVQPGGACANFDDCAPICCGCANGSGSALARPHCNKGTCATQDEICCAFDKWSDICRRGPSSTYIKACDKDADCASGLTCIRRYQVTSRDSQIGAVCEGGYQQKICTKPCTTDSQCSAFDAACTGSASCDGPKNLCYEK